VAQADPATAPPGAEQATGWYVALGDSVAAGYQPGLGDDPQGGYVGRVLAAVQASAPTTNLANLACSGETSTTLVSGGHCDYVKGSQLAEALAFLHAHTYTTRLVTVTIGANDVTPCLATTDFTAIQTCLQARLTVLAANLQQTLSEVQAAAPDAQVVVTNYYNPYLATWFADPALAQLTSVLQGRLNAVIAGVASSQGDATADVAGAFDSDDFSMSAGQPMPTNVAMVCRLTWMCVAQNIHPNDAGYAVIASAVIAKLS